ncbi:MAG: peptidase M48 [Bacteroidetes bacterium HGW-Bacteroidetes-17]|jgi:predicted Zn-dependent protease|nr:MAG: peptidase M48 [Bacteroidetes bacterium HGW-Bacteroidetes-17]
MKNPIFLLLLVILLTSCSTVLFTGRKQLQLLPASEMNAMALESYGTFLKENKLSTNAKDVALLNKVGNKIKIAVEKYLMQQGQQKIIEGYNWEFNLIESPTVNAWAMPGGKIVFYTGIMDVCKDETGIAVVMSHEIAHIIASHGNERMSQGLLTQLGGLGLSIALKEKPQETQNLFLGAYGVTTQLAVTLPYSRTHEYEADKIGLIFMAMAGYNPEAGIDFWVRMDAQSKGQASPEFLSTHPTHKNRIQAMKDFLPEAKTYAKK